MYRIYFVGKDGHGFIDLESDDLSEAIEEAVQELEKFRRVLVTRSVILREIE